MHHIEALQSIVCGSPWLMDALSAVRASGLRAWCVGAGAVRNVVWDHLHQHPTPSLPADVDVAYFDPQATPDHAGAVAARLRQALPSCPWEVTNQAFVHVWFREALGQAVEPLTSLEDALSTWPEYATCVGVRLNDDDGLEVIAPHGLDDLFSMRVRRNPRRVSLETYRQRIASKDFARRWPQVRVEL